MDNVSLLKNLYEAFGRGDVPAVLGAMSPQMKWHEAEGNPYMPSGEAWVGPDAVLTNLFMKLGPSGTDSLSTRSRSTGPETASLSKAVTPAPTKRRARAWTRRCATCGTSRTVK